MAGKLEKAILTLGKISKCDAGSATTVDPRCLLLVTILYLITVLSLPVGSLGMLIWFALYPIVESPLCGLSYYTVFVRSLVVLPFVAFIGVFNPVIHTETAFCVAGVAVSQGWVEFMSILLRGLLSMQAVVILISATGFVGMCRSLGRLGVPSFLTTQLMLIYRYLTVLLQEALSMRRAREARGFGRKTMPIKVWGPFVGQLFLRTVARSQRIHRAMLARGFNDTFPPNPKDRTLWRLSDTAVLCCWAIIFIAMRMFNISGLLHLS